MPSLSSRERAALRSSAHSLKPVLQLGSEGVTPAFLQALSEAFHTRDLLKIRVLETSDLSTREAAQEIAARVPEVEIVQEIGRVVAFYRPLPDDSG
ncbi:MAG: YhbY family RNA-binding protein [Gemmatimonadota bacterium]